MGGFGTIDDLLKKNEPGEQSGAPASMASTVAAAGDTTSDVFRKKMAQIGLKDKEIQTKRAAAQIGVPHMDLEKFPISPAALRLLPVEQAQELGAVAFFANNEQFRIGALNPKSEGVAELVAHVAEQTGATGSVYMISERSFKKVIELYKTLPNIKPVSHDVAITAEELNKVAEAVTDFSTFQTLLEKTSTTDLVTYIMGAGLKLGASDVHIEAEQEGIIIRFRMDGILQDAAILPTDLYKKLVSRLKLLASLKINITSKPQDGRFTITKEDGDVDVRVSTIPTVYGESVVMRLLVQREEPLSFEDLGIRGYSLEVLKQEIARPNGMIITTGPTGSGKTTTLYSIMHQLNKPDVKIITLEDPVEYKMEGINQSQIDRSKDYTFAKGLKSMLRQDPDIAMVGEIRELETADIAIQASLTGHLILSTLHTNNAFGAIPRFLAMGVKPFLLAPAMNCMIGQRLVRRLHPEKKVPATLTPEQQERVEKVIASLPEALQQEVRSKPMQFYTAPDHESGGAEGYKGRIGIYEVIQMTKQVEQHILAGKVSEYDIQEIAVQQGTITMVQDGILKALDGLTSVDEVFRVIE